MYTFRLEMRRRLGLVTALEAASRYGKPGERIYLMKRLQNSSRERLTLINAPLCVVLCAILCLLAGAPFAAAQTNITGFWILKTPTGDGNFREMFLDLKQDGESVTGKVMFGPRREIPISDGTLRNAVLHFTVTFGQPPRTREVTYDGTVEGDKISLTSVFPGRAPVTGVAERGDPKAMLPPARIPPPALHDVLDNGLARTPPMGWNSWNKFAGKVTDADVRGMADAMVSSGMKDAGYVYINIDDTWEGPRDANGNITSNLKFPDMKALADYVHSKGLKIGI